MKKQYRISLVEDDPAVATSLKEGLTKEGYGVDWFTHGEEAIRQAKAQAPDMFILDVRLPDISGFDVCQRLRKLQFNQPILILTVQSDEVDKVLGLEMGADDYVTKPYGLREILSRIRALLRRTYGDLSANEGDVLYIGDLIIERSRGRVLRGERAINLSPTEFRLLVFLARHRGQALTRAQILDAVWGYSSDVESESTINVNIRRLREKLEYDPGKPSLILTVPGIGYRIVDAE